MAMENVTLRCNSIKGGFEIYFDGREVPSIKQGEQFQFVVKCNKGFSKRFSEVTIRDFVPFDGPDHKGHRNKKVGGYGGWRQKASALKLADGSEGSHAAGPIKLGHPNAGDLRTNRVWLIKFTVSLKFRDTGEILDIDPVMDERP